MTAAENAVALFGGGGSETHDDDSTWSRGSQVPGESGCAAVIG